jgi:hypothetical protein
MLSLTLDIASHLSTLVCDSICFRLCGQVCALFIDDINDAENLNTPAMIALAADHGLSLWTLIFAVTVWAFQNDEDLKTFVQRGFSFGSNPMLDLFTW